MIFTWNQYLWNDSFLFCYGLGTSQKQKNKKQYNAANIGFDTHYSVAVDKDWLAAHTSMIVRLKLLLIRDGEKNPYIFDTN